MEVAEGKIQKIMEALGMAYFENMPNVLEGANSGSLSSRLALDELWNRWILYQYDASKNACSLRYVLPELQDAIKLY